MSRLRKEPVIYFLRAERLRTPAYAILVKRMNKPPKQSSQKERPVVRFALGTVEKFNRNVIQKPAEVIDSIDLFLINTLETTWWAHFNWMKDARHRSGMYDERVAYEKLQKKPKQKKILRAREKIEALERRALEREVRLMTFEEATELAIQNQVRNINAQINSFELGNSMGIHPMDAREITDEGLVSELKDLLVQIKDKIRLFEPPFFGEREDADDRKLTQSVLESLGGIEASIKDLLAYIKREKRSHAARDAFFEFVKETQDSIDIMRNQRLQKETPEGRMMRYQEHKAKVRELFIATDARKLKVINKKRVIAESKAKTGELFAGRNPNFKRAELEREGAESLLRFVTTLLPQAEKFESVGRLRSIVDKYPNPKDLGDMPLGYDVEEEVAETTLSEEVREAVRTTIYLEQYVRGNSVESGLHPREVLSAVRYHQVSPATLKAIQQILEKALFHPHDNEKEGELLQNI